MTGFLRLIVSIEPWRSVIPALVAISLCYFTGLAIYRFYFSPTAKFPGPKLAAITTWYESYYKVVLRGQFTFHIQDLHKKYGVTPAVTIYTDPTLQAQ